MKLELERSGFLKVWQVAEKYTPAKTTMEALNGIRITADPSGTVTLEATDLKASVKCPAKGATVIEPGVAVLNSAVFGNMLKKVSAQQITLEVSGARGTLTTESSKSRFAVIPPDTFPNIQASSGAEEVCALQASDLGKLITEGSCAASAPSDFPKYMGTSLLRTTEDLLIAVSTDGRRLARSQRPAESISKQTDLILPATALKDLAKIFTGDEIVRILYDGSMVWFVLEKPEQNTESSVEAENTEPADEETYDEDVNADSEDEESNSEDENADTDGEETAGEDVSADSDGEENSSEEVNVEAEGEEADGEEVSDEDEKPAPAPKESYLVGAEFSLRSVDATFPKYERILNDEVMTSLTIDRKYMMSALDRIAVIARNNTSQIMSMEILPFASMELLPRSALRIASRAPGLGTAVETLRPEKVDGGRMQIGYNINFLLDGLKAAASTDVYLEFSDAEGQTRIFRSKDDKDFMYMLMPLRLSPQDLVDDNDDSDIGTTEDMQDEEESPQEDYGDEAPQEESGESNAPF